MAPEQSTGRVDAQERFAVLVQDLSARPGAQRPAGGTGFGSNALTFVRR